MAVVYPYGDDACLAGHAKSSRDARKLNGAAP